MRAPHEADPDELPAVFDPAAVGTYPPLANAGGGLVWDEVLEYRVWFSGQTQTDETVDDAFHAFATASEAIAAAAKRDGAGDPVALVLQREYIDEPEPGQYVHVMEERVTEWPPRS